MNGVHAFVGFAIVGGFALLALWGLATWLIRRGPGKAFWWLLGTLQAALILQLLVGLALLAMGGTRGILHYLYGVAFPVLILVGAHWLGREAFADRPWAPFAVGSFFIFGLTLRALMTGLGIG